MKLIKKLFKCRHKYIRFTTKQGVLWYCEKCGYEEPMTERMIEEAFFSDDRLRKFAKREGER